jgi:ABC-type multidrug transport system fused ATPase/permease subunit
LVFEDGRVIEQGAHEQLIADETSHYRKLYEMQTLGLIGKE